MRNQEPSASFPSIMRVHARHGLRGLLLCLLLALLLAPAQAQQPRCGNSGNYRGVVSPGTYSGSVNEGPWDAWCFDAERGDSVSIETWRTSGNLIPALYLHENRMDTYQLADDQNPDGGDRAWISNYVIPESGRYLISAGRVCCTAGSYQLRFDIASSEPPDRGSDRGYIDYGERRSGWIGDGNWYEDYRFYAQSGDMVTIALDRASGNLDPVLELRDSSGSELTSNDDGGSNRNSLISDYRLRSSGEYRIRARRFNSRDGSSSGDYSLSLRRVTRPPADQPPANRDPNKPILRYGDSTTGYLDDRNYFDDFLFEARSGDIVSIALNRTSGNLDPKLRLYDNSARLLASNDDGGAGNNALIEQYRIPSSGDYTIHALRYAAGQAGGYRLSLYEGRGPAMTATSPSRSGSSFSSRGDFAIVVGSSCSLADAIRSANRDRSVGGCQSGTGADTIALDESVNLRSELPSIESRISIEGYGNTISGRGNYRIFTIERYGELTLRDDGRLNLVGDGGAILNEGVLSTSNVDFRGNVSGEDGGAIRNAGDASISGGSFVGNRAQRQAGAIYSAHTSGSGPDSTRLSIDDVEFSRNDSTRHAGAVFVSGQASVDDSVFSGNTAQISGGAFYSVGNATIRRSDFRRNQSFKNGGAVFNDYEAHITISDSEFSDNSTRTAGGGVFSYARASASIDDSRFTDNSASEGGGVYVKGLRRSGTTYYGELNLRDNRFSGNRGGDCVIGEYGDLRVNRGNRFSDGGCRWS